MIVTTSPLSRALGVALFRRDGSSGRMLFAAAAGFPDDHDDRAASRMMVEPCSNHPISSPLRSDASHEEVSRPFVPRRTEAARQETAAGYPRPVWRRPRPGSRMAGAGKPGPDHRPLILQNSSLDPLQRRRIDIPGVAREVRDQTTRQSCGA
jgi:hypothetical protein